MKGPVNAVVHGLLDALIAALFSFALVIAAILLAGCFSEDEALGGQGEGSGEGGSEGSSESSGGGSSAGSAGATSVGSSSESSGGESSESSGSSESSESEASPDVGVLAALYELCLMHEDCVSAFCLVADDAQAGYCTEPCVTHEDCEGYPAIGALAISCAGSWGPKGLPVCVLNCPQGDGCPEGTSCGTWSYGGEQYGGLCG